MINPRFMSNNILAKDKVLYKGHAEAAVAAISRHVADEAMALIDLEPVAALLSRKTGSPVKLMMTRAEVFEGTGPMSGTCIRVKMGARSDGRLTAGEAYLVYEAGAFPGSPVNAGAQCIFSPYDIPNARVEGYDVVVNKPKAAAYRAPGAPAAAFAAETVVDELCEQLHIDPLEFRLLNGAHEGTWQVAGPRFPRIGYLETVQAAKDHPHYTAPLEGPYRGRGVASGYWHNSTGPASAIISVTADGSVSLVEGSMDIGGSRAAAAMHVAEVLGITYDAVRPSVGDTDSVGFTSTTGGSSATFKTGWACYQAAHDVKRQMIERAAKLWEITSDDVEYVRGVLSDRRNPERRLTFRELARRRNNTGGPVVGRANLAPRGVGAEFSVHIVDVEVDPETGKTQILRYTALQDVGKAIHPSYVEGQIQGGAVQGIGWALNEEYIFNTKGAMLNASFLDYRMPTSLDLPMIDTVLVEVTNPGHPFGLRGVGEVPIVPPMAAIANAIYRATSVRMRQLPMSPSKVLEALWVHQKNGHHTNGGPPQGAPSAR
jgi:xanthine dehydrogenase molybdenum-binding subunit